MFKVMVDGSCIDSFVHVKEFDLWMGINGKADLMFGTMNPDVVFK